MGKELIAPQQAAIPEKSTYHKLFSKTYVVGT